jgi:signal transduction histidine kinase
MLQRAHRLAGTSGNALRDELREIHEAVQSALEKVRTLSQALHPVVLEDVGFESAVDTYISTFERRNNIEVHYTKSGQHWNIPPEPSIHVYRVLQEALNNVARHSGAKMASVRLTRTPGSMVLEIEDNGSGFRESAGLGLGLISMRERAELAGGNIEFLKGAGGGALVRMSIPVSAEEPHATISP